MTHEMRNESLRSGGRAPPAPVTREAHVAAGKEAGTGSKGQLMTSETTQKLSLFALTGMVVGSMVGAGIFSLPRTFASATGPFGAIIAWCIAGTGMYMLA